MSTTNTNIVAGFTITDHITVPDNYKWDLGVPYNTFPVEELVFNDPKLVVASNNNTGFEYIGRSPYMSVAVFATHTPAPNAVAIKRVYDFGDYYNSESSIVITTDKTKPSETVCHNYIMPGLYTIKLTVTEYRAKATTPAAAGTYDIAKKSKSDVVFWQWKYFESCTTEKYPETRELKWNSPVCKQTTWKNATPCVKPTECRITDDADPCANNGGDEVCTKWSEIDCNDPTNTWGQQTCSACDVRPTPEYEIVTTEIVRTNIVRVIETSPVAYISVQQDQNINNRVSPYTVRISPKDVISGSFPIEKIDWDLGDGTPIKSQRRWDINNDPEFVYNNEYSIDWKDPRNYDVVHTYTKSPESGFTFYPSITCYSSSTASHDCVSGVVGPLRFDEKTGRSNTSITKLSLMQNEMTENGSVLLGEVNKTAVIWKM
jgi:hypothetical protein